MISFVVVLPLEPVTPIRVTDARLRILTRARFWSAGKGVRHGHDAQPVAGGEGIELRAPSRGLGIRDEQRGGARRGGLAEELVAVGALARAAPRRGSPSTPRANRWPPTRSPRHFAAARHGAAAAGHEGRERLDRLRFAGGHHRAAPRGRLPDLQPDHRGLVGRHEAEGGGFFRDPFG